LSIYRNKDIVSRNWMWCNY